MELHDEIVAGVEAPREVVRRERRRLSRRPAEKMAVGIVGRAQDHALVAGLGIGLVQPPRRRRRIDADVGVVHAAIARAELQAAHVARAGTRHGDDEVAEHVGAVGAQRVLGKRDDEIGRAELPAGVRRAALRAVRALALEAAAGDPARDRPIWASDSRRSPTNSPDPGSGFHGGMYAAAS